jgi:hypothetical protein
VRDTALDPVRARERAIERSTVACVCAWCVVRGAWCGAVRCDGGDGGRDAVDDDTVDESVDADGCDTVDDDARIRDGCDDDTAGSDDSALCAVWIWIQRRAAAVDDADARRHQRVVECVECVECVV